MKARIQRAGQSLEIDYSRGRSLAIDLDPHGPQPSFFTSAPASAAPMKAGGFIGNVAAGGSCNAELVTLAPHCHGTHTECLGHISPERINVQNCIYAEPALAQLISLDVIMISDPDQNPLFTVQQLRQALGGQLASGVEALIIRSWPVPEDLACRDYSQSPPYPVLETAAMQWLSAQPLKHLLIESPSLDPASDRSLQNHRFWWGQEHAVHCPDVDSARRSVTEMIIAPADIDDGLYWLHLELSPLLGDATPSRPIIYPVTECEAD